MMNERDMQGRTPAQERAEIGTPAGETPNNGRKRHGTHGLTDEEYIEAIHRRGHIKSENEIEEEDFRECGDEISVTGGITGTKIMGGIPAGGAQAGGTLGKYGGIESWEHRS